MMMIMMMMMMMKMKMMMIMMMMMTSMDKSCKSFTPVLLALFKHICSNGKLDPN